MRYKWSFVVPLCIRMTVVLYLFSTHNNPTQQLRAKYFSLHQLPSIPSISLCSLFTNSSTSPPFPSFLFSCLCLCLCQRHQHRAVCGPGVVFVLFVYVTVMGVLLVLLCVCCMRYTLWTYIHIYMATFSLWYGMSLPVFLPNWFCILHPAAARDGPNRTPSCLVSGWTSACAYSCLFMQHLNRRARRAHRQISIGLSIALSTRVARYSVKMSSAHTAQNFMGPCSARRSEVANHGESKLG